MIVADLHFGKTGHFRKSGIAVPQNIFKEDLQRLFAEIQYCKPKQLVIAGDMFHSDANKEMDLFLRWRKDISYLPIQLVKGNHDILHDEFYQSANIETENNKLDIDHFSFVHDISVVNSQWSIQNGEKKNTENYFFSGHVHPGIVISGNSRQSLCFSCFYFGAQYAILPAFSAFTGFYAVKPKKNDSVFAIVKDSLMKIG